MGYIPTIPPSIVVGQLVVYFFVLKVFSFPGVLIE